MPAFDLKGIRCAKYTKEGETVKYLDLTSVGDAMNVNLDLRFAEGRLYTESSLSEYMKSATGGTISIGVKYIPYDAQVLLYKAVKTARDVLSKKIDGIKFTKKSNGQYVGVAFYAPDMIDEVEKYTCVFIYRALFGPPSMAYQTKGESIVFQTPTTTGEFLPANTEDGVLLEFAVCDTEDEAVAWTKAVFGETSSTMKAPAGAAVATADELAEPEDATEG